MVMNGFLPRRSKRGVPRPFSISILEQNKGGKGVGAEVLTIREHLFKYRGQFYMLTESFPEGRPKQSLQGPRYISRLDNFPYLILQTSMII